MIVNLLFILASLLSYYGIKFNNSQSNYMIYFVAMCW